MNKTTINKLKNIGTEMRSYREMKGIKQAGLGRRLGVSGRTISAYELGNATPKLKTVIKFLEVCV